MLDPVEELETAVGARHHHCVGPCILSLIDLETEYGEAVRVGFLDGDHATTAAAADALFLVGSQLTERVGRQDVQQPPRLLDVAATSLDLAGIVEPMPPLTVERTLS